MLRKILPLLYGCWFLHMMIVNNVFELGINLLTFTTLFLNGLAIGALYVVGYELDV